jgi:hypothetical protein
MTRDDQFALESLYLPSPQLRSREVRGRKAPTVLLRLRSCMEPKSRWVPRPRCGASKPALEFLLENMESVFGAYVGGREWYFLVQWVSSAASGIVLGVLTVVGNDVASLACPTAYAGCGVAIAFGVADVVLATVLRPMCVPLELWGGVLIASLSIVSQALAAGNALTASNLVTTVAALLELVVVVVLMLHGAAVEGPSKKAAATISDESMLSTDAVPANKQAPRTTGRRVTKHRFDPQRDKDDILILMACDQEHRLELLVELAARQQFNERQSRIDRR